MTENFNTRRNNLIEENFSDKMKDDLENGLSSAESAKPETPRKDKQQPIIIQNFDLLPQGREKFKRKPLAVANLYLSPAILSRRNVRNQNDSRSLSSNEEATYVETRPDLYKSFGPSSSSVSGTPFRKLKTKKQVTFHDDHRSSPGSADDQNGDSWTPAVKSAQLRPTIEDCREDVRDKHTSFAVKQQPSGSSQRPKAFSEFTFEHLESTNASVHGQDFSTTFSPKFRFSSYSPSSDTSKSDSTTQKEDSNQSGNEAANEPPVSNSGIVKTYLREGNYNKKSPECNITWYKKEQSEIESLMNASRDDSNRYQTHNNKLHDSASKNIIEVDTARKSNFTESETNVPRKVIRVNFLKDNVQMVQRSNTTIPIHKTVYSPEPRELVLDKDSREGSIHQLDALNRLRTGSHLLNEYQGQRTKVEDNASFLMQYYSSLGDKSPNQEVYLGDADRLCSFEYTDRGLRHVEKDASFDRDDSRVTKLRGREASNPSEARFNRARVRSCSVVETSLRSFTRADGDAFAERFLLGSDFRLTERRTARNKLLEEFIINTMKSGSKIAVEKRLKSACPS